MKRKFYITAFLLAIVFFFTKDKISLAQGSFTCIYSVNTSSFSPETSKCSLSKDNCAEGYVPSLDCSQFKDDKENCNKKRDCIKKEEQDKRCIAKGSALQCTDKNYPITCAYSSRCCRSVDDCCTDGPENCKNVAVGPEFSCDNNTGVKTALGCIPANSLNDFVGWLLKKLIFIASGIAFLLMALGAIQILTSAGKPESVKAGGELITSAISGLLLIILSLFLLKLIGVDILHIPGFAK